MKQKFIFIICLSLLLSGCASLSLIPIAKLSDSQLHWYIGETCYSPDKYREELISRHSDWPDDIKNLIRKGTIKIGMTKEQVLASIGKPTNINETITTFIQDEQWVYSNCYLYFSNNKLTSWQTFR